MAEFSKLVITKQGQALIAKMPFGAGNVEFTRISTSSQTLAGDELENLTALPNTQQTSLISKITRVNDVVVKAEAAFSNVDLTAGYYLRALGLYANDPDIGEILYAVTAEISGNCYVPAYNGITVSGVYVQLVTMVGHADNVSFEIKPGAIATVGDVRNLQQQIDNMKSYVDGLSATVTQEIIIPTDGWATGAEESRPGDLYVDIASEDITEDMVPIISIYPGHTDIAKGCGMRTTSRTIPGALRLYAEKAPAEAIRANLTLLTASYGAAGGGEAGERLPEYTGRTEVFPSHANQVLPTKNKSVSDDITVRPIEVTEVSNPQGGKTVSI